MFLKFLFASIIKMQLYTSLLLTLVIVASCDAQGLGLWCYRCVSTHPGCGSRFDWRWYWSYTCPGANDKCVKIIERKGAEEVITRDCLSSIQGIRRDIPADVYEGCRPAAKDVKLAQYVFNDIDELDIRRNYYDNTTFCFCDFDHFCNSVSKPATSAFITIVGFLCLCFNLFQQRLF